MACCLSAKSRVTNNNREKRREVFGRDEPAVHMCGVGWCGVERNKEKMKERRNILQEKARPCSALADEYLLESTKD